MADNRTTRSEPRTPFFLDGLVRERLRRQAELAWEQFNFPLADELYQRAAERRPYLGVNYLRVPDASSVEEMWKALDAEYFAEQNAWRVNGVFRPLSLAMASIQSRSFLSNQFAFGQEMHGHRPLAWESRGSVHDPLYWRVEAQVLQQGRNMSVSECVIFVRDNAAPPGGQPGWSGFFGLPAVFMQKVLLYRLTTIAARYMVRGIVQLPSTMALAELLPEEQSLASEKRCSPVAGFTCPRPDHRGSYRIVLWDDANGAGSLRGSREALAWMYPLLLGKLFNFLNQS